MTKRPVKEAVTAADVNVALMKLFQPDRYVTMFDVGSSTGAGVNRRADALVQSLWPSDCLRLLGIEVKVSRADWQREMADAGKSEAFARYCDAFALCAPRDVCRPGEVPPGWGLLLYEDGALRWSVRPVYVKPEPIEASMRAAMLRAAAKGVESVGALRASIERDERVRVQSQYQGRVASAEERTREVERKLGEMRDACGVYSTAQVRAAVELLEKQGVDYLVDQLLARQKSMVQQAAKLSAVVDALQAVPA